MTGPTGGGKHMHMDFLHQLGGVTKVAKMLNIPVGPVTNWTRRGVPWRWRHVLARIANQRGVKLPLGFLNPLGP